MKTLTNLEFKKNGQKNNAIVSRETLGESKQITALQEENGIFKYETADGVKEIKVDKPTNTPYTIKANDWVASEAPFKFKATLTLPRKVDANDEVKLDINNELAKFKNYQIGATNLTAETLDLVAMKQPLEDLNISLVIGKTDLLKAPIKPTSAKFFTFEGSACTGYVGDQNAPEIVIPRSYDIASDGSFIDGDKYVVDNIIGVNYLSGFEYYTGNVIMLDNITHINDSAFASCRSIKHIEMANSVIYIGDSSMLGMDMMKTINLPNSIKIIEQFAFYGSSLVSMIIPKSVIEISSFFMMQSRSLGVVEIPNTITKIGDNAFNDCISLNNIIYDGTIQQWNAIQKGDAWNRGVPATVVHCTDGDAPIGGN